MAIRRPDPVRALAEMQDRMNRLFDEFRTRAGSDDGDRASGAAWEPAVDLVERDDRYQIQADLPGVDPGEVHVEVEAGTLTVRGERRAAADVPREAYLRAERPTGAFVVRLSLPPSVDVDGIRASHRSGVLEVVLPKRREAARDAVRVAVDGSGVGS